MFDLWFDDFGGAWATWMATATIEALIVLLIVGTIWFFIRGRVAPQVGVWLFLLVPLKLLIPIPVPAPALIANWTPAAVVAKFTSTQIPESEIAPPISEPIIVAQPQLLETLVTNNEAVFPEVANSQPDVAPMPSTKINETNDAATFAAASNPTATSNFSLNLLTILMLAWATIVGFLGLCFLLREIRFRRRLRSATRLADQDLKFDFQTLCESADVRRPVRLLCSEAVTAPAVHGVLRPSIILPKSALEQLSPAQLRWAVLHELAHIRRHDLAFILLQRVVSWLFFFHPAVWIANRTVHQLREFACDDWAILQAESTQHDSRSTDAGEAFLQILRSASKRSCGEVALSVLGIGPRKSCQQRLQRMLDTDRHIKPALGWVSICGLLLTAVVLLPQLSAASQQTPIVEPAVAKANPQADKKADAKAKPTATTSSEDAWRFDLQVVDTEGELVPQARLRISQYHLPEVERVLAGKQGKKTKTRIEFKCDAQGKLSIQLSSKPKVFRFVIRTDGYGPYTAWWSHPNLANQIPQRFTAELERAWTMAGRVVDEAGDPIANTKVSLRFEAKKRPGDQRQGRTGDELTTDEDGRWTFRRAPVSVDLIKAEINSESHQSKVVSLARKDFEAGPDNAIQPGGTIVLSKGLTLSGKVSNDRGEPLSGAEVRIRFLNSVRRATTGIDGRYQVGGCEPGSIEALISAPGMAIEKKKVSIVPDGDDVDFVLKPSKGIRIRVVDEAGKPLARSQICFQKWRGDSAYFFFDEVNQYADENGVWEWKEAPLDEFTAGICRPKGMNLADQKLIAREEEYVFTPPPQLFVSGTVADSITGEEIKSFRVVLGIRPHGRDRIWIENEAYASSDGTYRIQHESQTYEAHLVRIEANGYRPVVSRDIASDEGEVTLDFKLEPAEMTSTQILDAEGEPVSDAVVVIGSRDSRISIRNGRLLSNKTKNATQLRTNNEGRVEFLPRLDPFQLVILHDRGFAKVVAEKMNIPQEIKLTEWAVVEGKYLLAQQSGEVISVDLNTNGLASHEKGEPSIFFSYDHITNIGGDFRFDRVVPKDLYVERRTEWVTDEGATRATSRFFKKTVAVAGETQKLQAGKLGLPVVGRLPVHKDVDGSKVWPETTLRLMPQNSEDSSGVPNPDVFFAVSLFSDGSFRIDDVPAGDWVLTGGGYLRSGVDGNSWEMEGNWDIAPTKFTIADDDQGEKNIGDIPISKRHMLGDWNLNWPGIIKTERVRQK